MIVVVMVVLAAGIVLFERWPKRWPQMPRWLLVVGLTAGVVTVMAIEWWYWLFY